MGEEKDEEKQTSDKDHWIDKITGWVEGLDILRYVAEKDLDVTKLSAYRLKCLSPKKIELYYDNLPISIALEIFASEVKISASLNSLKTISAFFSVNSSIQDKI